jgi:hypothetical protein
VYLRLPLSKLLPTLLLPIALSLVGCGGGGAGESPAARQVVRGAGYRFAAPSDWNVRRDVREVSVSPTPGAEELVSVSVFRLLKPFQPALWEKVVGELDRTADQLAGDLGGKVTSSRTVTVGGLRARVYEIAYEREGRKLRNRIGFVLRARTEYQLLCRWPAAEKELEACGLLFDSFTLS